MSKIALDLKDFKHVKSDKDTTTLQHKQGHQLTISHKSLKPEFKSQLQALAGGTKDGPLSAEPSMLPPSEARDNAVAFGRGEGKSVGQQMSEGLDNAGKELSKLNPFHKAEGGPVMMAQGGTPYEQGLPCLNPHCKSHGRPHPNCRCYSGMAEGGKAVRYCAHGTPHKPDCMYFADGGEINNNQVEAPDINADPGAALPQEGEHEGALSKVLKTGEKIVSTAAKAIAMMADGGDPKGAPDAINNAFGKTINALESPHPIDDVDAPPANPDAEVDKELAASEPKVEQPAPAIKPASREPKPYTVAPVVDDTQTPLERFDEHKGDVEQKLLDAQIEHPDAPETRMLQHLNTENQAFAHDLANGHITPKTYRSMFEDRGTLGRIGAIFGLMLSSAGSGLAGQPNAFLHRMDQEISNDLAAQIKSKDNAQNFLRLNQAALMNKANVRALDTENQVKAFAVSQGQILQSTYNEFALHVAAMPELTPQDQAAKQMATQKLAMIHDAVGSKINNVNALAESSAAYYKTMFGDGAVNDPEALKKRINAGLMMGPKGQAMATNLRDTSIPGVMGQASKIITEGDRARVDAHNVLDNKINDVLAFARKHSNLKDQASPAVIKEGAQKAHELAAFYNKTVDNLGMTSGRLDWLDKQIKSNPQSIIQQLLGNNAVLNEIKNSNATRKDLFLTKTLGFPQQSRAKSPGQDATPIKGKDGRMYIQKGNYMVPVK